MDNVRINQMLCRFSKGRKIADIKIRTMDFTNEEIEEVVEKGYIMLAETTPWGDNRFKITDKGLAFRDKVT